MRQLFFAGAAALATLLAACAAEPTATTNANAAPPAANAADEVVCTREYPIGSNIPINKCRTRAQIEAERASSQETVRGGQTGGGGGAKPGG